MMLEEIDRLLGLAKHEEIKAGGDRINAAFFRGLIAAYKQTRDMVIDFGYEEPDEDEPGKVIEMDAARAAQGREQAEAAMRRMRQLGLKTLAAKDNTVRRGNGLIPVDEP